MKVRIAYITMAAVIMMLGPDLLSGVKDEEVWDSPSVVTTESKSTSEEDRGFLPVAQLPTLAAVMGGGVTREVKPSISGYCHVLLYYGLGPTDYDGIPDGSVALAALTNDQVAKKIFGYSPLIKTRNGIRYLTNKEAITTNDRGETHRDQCLATFASLGLPLTTKIGIEQQNFTLADLLSESVANFSLQQKELTWTVCAYLKYMPANGTWKNRFGEVASFSEVTKVLMNLHLSEQSCGGLHVLQALVKVMNADSKSKLLDSATRDKLRKYIQAKAVQITKRQDLDGGWMGQWCDDVRPFPRTISNDILIAGHLLEVLQEMQGEVGLSQDVYTRARHFLEFSLKNIQGRVSDNMICPCTHALLACSAGRRSEPKMTFLSSEREKPNKKQ